MKKLVKENLNEKFKEDSDSVRDLLGHLDKLNAIEYLVKHEVVYDEWSEADMYHAVKHILNSENNYFTDEYLNLLLKEVENH